MRDEDWLFDIVFDLYENDSSYSKLFSAILFANLSTESIEKFIERFSIDDIDQEIWRSFCKRLLQSEKYEKVEERYMKLFKEFRMEKGHGFEGIMNSLIKETGGNIHVNGTIEITSNSINSNKQQKISLITKTRTFIYLMKSQAHLFVLISKREEFSCQVIQLDQEMMVQIRVI